MSSDGVASAPHPLQKRRDYYYWPGNLTTKELADLVKLLNIRKDRFFPCTVYDKKSKKNMIDTSIRDADKITYPYKSETKSIFDFLAKQMRLVPHENWKLQLDSIEVISYEKGGFFLPHRDEAKDVENDYTLLVCLTAPTKGGETKVEDKTFALEVGDVLCFRKQALHEGVRVEEGTKVLVKANVTRYFIPMNAGAPAQGKSFSMSIAEQKACVNQVDSFTYTTERAFKNLGMDSYRTPFELIPNPWSSIGDSGVQIRHEGGHEFGYVTDKSMATHGLNKDGPSIPTPPPKSEEQPDDTSKSAKKECDSEYEDTGPEELDEEEEADEGLAALFDE